MDSMHGDYNNGLHALSMLSYTGLSCQGGEDQTSEVVLCSIPHT